MQKSELQSELQSFKSFMLPVGFNLAARKHHSNKCGNPGSTNVAWQPVATNKALQ